MISIVCPETGVHGGNRVTAERWAGLLGELGHEVHIAAADDGACQVMVALHARKSRAAIASFRARSPVGLLVVALTGTDLYGELDADVLASMQAATWLVLLQERGREVLPEALRGKAVTIHQSARAVAPIAGEPGAFTVIVLAHLRAVKDPFRAALAARLLPASSRVIVVHAGGALEPGMAERARAEVDANPRYRWLGAVPRAEALGRLAGAQVLVLSSLTEGGANVVTEAIAASVPVLSSRIDGSIGLLGEAHPGYFPVGDTGALAALLRRAEEEPAFLAALRARSEALADLVDPRRERDGWARIVG